MSVDFNENTIPREDMELLVLKWAKYVRLLANES